MQIKAAHLKISKQEIIYLKAWLQFDHAFNVLHFVYYANLLE